MTNQPENRIKGQEGLKTWILQFVKIGSSLVQVNRNHPNKRLTLALCMPRDNFAAILLGLGIIRGFVNQQKEESETQRIKNLIGKWVSYQTPNGKHIIGQLEFDDESSKYKICIFEKNKGCQVGSSVNQRYIINPNQLSQVQATGQNFNITKGATKKASQAIFTQHSTFQTINTLIGTHLDHSYLEESNPIFQIIGSKSRLESELSQPFHPFMDSPLSKVLRPHGIPEYSSSAKCSIASSRLPLPGCHKNFVILESSPNLPDHLNEFKEANRIVLLSRNKPTYIDSIDAVLEFFSLSDTKTPLPNFDLPIGTNSLAFWHQ